MVIRKKIKAKSRERVYCIVLYLPITGESSFQERMICLSLRIFLSFQKFYTALYKLISFNSTEIMIAVHISSSPPLPYLQSIKIQFNYGFLISTNDVSCVHVNTFVVEWTYFQTSNCFMYINLRSMPCKSLHFKLRQLI